MLCVWCMISFGCVLLTSSVADVQATTCSPCGLNAACHNTVGTPTCACNCGYHGDPTNCTATGPPLGVGNRIALPDSRMTASSNLNDSRFDPAEGRLHGPSAWCAGNNTIDEYLQVDLQFPRLLVRIATQGQGSVGSNSSANYVVSYKLRSSIDGLTWNKYTYKNGSRTEKVFAGNADSNSVVCHVINESARYVRLYPQSSHGRMCMRLELYGATDECSLGLHNCPFSATCVNTEGSYTCACGEGRRWDGSNCTSCPAGHRVNGTICTDIDECGEGLSSCSTMATCLNTIGSYNCSCKDGFAGNGLNCSDLDECSLGTAHCHSNAVCNNTRGSYECRCACGDIHECSASKCHLNSSCEYSNTQGSHSCQCKRGFSGNGTVCIDVDECTRTNNCSRYADCDNTQGSYGCTCRQGYVGNGLQCTAVKTPETDIDKSETILEQYKVVFTSSFVILGVALVGIAGLVFYRRQRRVRKKMRPSITTMGPADQMDDDMAKWRDSVSLHSSYFSIPSLHPSALSLVAQNFQPLWTRRELAATPEMTKPLNLSKALTLRG